MTAQLFRALWRIDLDRRSYPSLDDHAMRRLQVLSPETDLRSPAARVGVDEGVEARR